MRSPALPVRLLAALALLAAPAPAEEEPLDRLSADLKKAVPKAFEGHEKSRQMLEAAGPLTKKAALEIEEKVLAPWHFPPLKPGRDQREFELAGKKCQYGVYVPKNYTPKRAWPLILSLHGAGGNGPGELGFIWAGVLSDWPGFVVAPSGQPPGAQWFPEQEPFVLGVLRDIARAANVDCNRVYVNGFSNGGNGSWWYAQKFPGLFGAMCTRGGGNPQSGLLGNLARVPAYIIHGENDGTIRVDSDRRDAEALKKLGSTVVYVEVKGGGHEPFNGENPKVLDFFTKHPRDPWPKQLKFQSAGAGRARDLWVEVPDGGGTVEAEVKEGNRIEIRGPSRVVLWLSDPLVDLDAELTVALNGTEAFKGKVERRFSHLLADLADRFDRQAPAWVRLELPAR